MYVGSEKEYVDRLWETQRVNQEAQLVRSVVKEVYPQMESTDVCHHVDSPTRIDVYVPPGMAFQIEEAIQRAAKAGNKITTPIMVMEVMVSRQSP